MAISTSTHTGFQIVLAKIHLPFPTGKLGALIGIDHNLVSGLSSSNGHKQRLQGEISSHPRLSRQSHYTAREQIIDHAKTKTTLMGFIVGNVSDPDPIRRRCLELLLQPSPVLSDRWRSPARSQPRWQACRRTGPDVACSLHGQRSRPATLAAPPAPIGVSNQTTPVQAG